MHRRPLLFAIAALLAVTGCSSDDDAADATDPPATAPPAVDTEPAAPQETSGADSPAVTDAPTETGGTPATEAPVATDAPTEPTGEPITLMVIAGTTTFTEAFDGVHAAAEAINARGGIDGAPVEIVDCEADDESTSVRCARDAVDTGVAAVVGAFTANGAIVPILEEAGIPIVAPQAVAAEYFSSPVSFPIQGGPVAMAGLPLALVEAGATNVGVTGTEGFESSTIVDLVIDQGIAASGATKIGSTVFVPFNAPDMSAQVSTVTSGDVQGVVLPLWATDIARFLVTADQLGAEVTFAAPSASVSPAVIDELGDVAEGLLLVGSFPPVSDGSEGMTRFRDEMAAFAPDAAVDEISLNGWLAVQIVAAQAAELESVDAAGLLEALNTAEAIDTAGILPPISFATPGATPGMTRLVNTKVFLSKVEDGTATLTVTEPVDPFAP